MRMAREEDGRCVNSSVVSQHGSLDAGSPSYGDKDGHGFRLASNAAGVRPGCSHTAVLLV